MILRASHGVVSLREVSSDGREQMAESSVYSRVYILYTAVIHFAFTSRFSAVAAELLISRHALFVFCYVVTQLAH